MRSTTIATAGLIFCAGLMFASARAEPSAPIRIACVGDSITYGIGTPDPADDSYPAQLAARLGRNWTVMNFGVIRATLLKKGDKPYWETNEYILARKFKPHVVIIALGTNDSKPRNWKHNVEFVADYVAMIESFRELESTPDILICYPVPAYPGNWGVEDQIIEGEIIPLIDRIARQTDVKVIDLYEALSNKKGLFPDKVHPNTEGARLIAGTIHAAIAAGEVNDVKK